MSEIFNTDMIGAVKPILLGIPESAGLLAFGIGLALAAVIIRKVLNKADAAKVDGGERKKV